VSAAPHAATEATGNGFSEYKRLFMDRFDNQATHNAQVIAKLDDVCTRLTRLETQRNSAAWIVGPGVGAGVAALVMLALRKLGL
jgi:glucokinase